jgi:ribosomal RNA-processing protein 9
MPDSFFVNPKKRKRPTSTSKGKQPSRPAVKPGKNGVKGGTKAPASKRKRTEDLDSDGTPDEGIDAIDDLDLAADNDEPVLSDAEDPNETPAEKRLRLAKVYLDSLKQDLGAFMRHSYSLAYFSQGKVILTPPRSTGSSYLHVYNAM